jgi:hypothetical protein
LPIRAKSGGPCIWPCRLPLSPVAPRRPPNRESLLGSRCVVSRCLPLSPVASQVKNPYLDPVVLSPVVSRCLPLSPGVSRRLPSKESLLGSRCVVSRCRGPRTASHCASAHPLQAMKQATCVNGAGCLVIIKSLHHGTSRHLALRGCAPSASCHEADYLISRGASHHLALRECASASCHEADCFMP